MIEMKSKNAEYSWCVQDFPARVCKRDKSSLSQNFLITLRNTLYKLIFKMDLIFFSRKQAEKCTTFKCKTLTLISWSFKLKYNIHDRCSSSQ